jgi:hypothetical protein
VFGTRCSVFGLPAVALAKAGVRYSV